MVSEIFGRESEIGVLEELLADLVNGRGAMLVIEGASGSGKSTLLGQSSLIARTAGVGVLLVGARPAARARELSVLRELTGKPELDGRVTASQVGVLLADRTGPGPLLIAVDDAQWLDRQTMSILDSLAFGSCSQPVLVLLARSRGTPADLERPTEHEASRRMSLRPLEEAALEGLAQALLPHADQSVWCTCAKQAAGNPLLVHELTELARDVSQAHEVTDLVSMDLHHRLLNQLARTGAAAEPVAVAVAVLASQARLDDIAALADCTVAEVAEILDSLVADDVLTSLGEFRYALASPFVARSLLAGAGVARVGLLHDHAARRLIERGAATEEIGAHLLCSPPRGISSHASILAHAGGSALERGEPTESARLLRRALAEPPAVDERPLVLIELGLALAHVDVGEAVEVLRIAVGESEPGLDRAHAAEQLGRTLLVYAGRPLQAVGAFARALEELPAGHPRRSDLELFHLNASREASIGEPGSSSQLGALIAHDDGDASTRLAALAELALENTMHGGDLNEALALARAALEGGVLLSAERPTESAAYSAVSTLMWCGDYDGCVRQLDELVTQATGGGSLAGEATARYCRARARLAQGQVSGALEDSRRVLSLEREGFTQRRMINHAILAGALIECGEPLRAAEILDLADPDDVDSQSSTAELLFWLMARARLALLQGRVRQAGEAFTRAGELAAGAGCENPAVVPWRSGSALAHAACGNSVLAHELLDEELERLRLFGGPADAIARALRIRASFAPRTGGLEDLQEAARLLEDFPPCLEHTHTLLALGRSKRQREDRSGALHALRTVLDLAFSGGALAAERDARAELSALGVRPRRTASSGVHALTPSEHRVARLASEGMTNREIAQRLFVTAKTVEKHLGNAYGKLDVTSRAQLPGALQVPAKSAASPSPTGKE